MFKKSIISVGLVVLAISVFVLSVSCADKLPDLIVLVGPDADTFDPHVNLGTATELYNENMYNHLVRFNKNLKIIPDLAESWELSEDNLTWTFTLRKNVKFHDGTPFNAEAVKISLERVIDPNTGSPARDVVADISSIEVVDDYTVKIKTFTPCGYLLNNLAHPITSIVSPTALKEYGKELGTHPIGTGPFIFKEWKVGSEIILERNPDYFNGAPKIGKLIFRVIPDDTTRAMLIESGRGDVALRIPSSEIERLNGKSDIVIELTDTVMTNYLPLNNTKKYLDNVKVRKALNYATNKEDIANNILTGMATIADAPISPNTWGYTPIGVYEYDLEKAKALLVEAGYPDGFDLDIWIAPGRHLMNIQITQLIQSDWAKIGVNLNIRQWEYQSLMSEIKKGEFNILYLGWSPSTADADRALYGVFHSSQWVPVGGNRALYHNEQVDSLLEAGKIETDIEKRKELYREAMEIIVDEAPWVFLYYPKQALVYRSNISNIDFLPTEHILFHQAVKE